jgi:hypothetical protein
MSATIADESVLVSDFDLDTKALERLVTPSTASDIGDRMILTPQQLDPILNNQDLKEFFKALSKQYNTVVIVPSHTRAEFWKDVADQILTVENLYDGVEDLKADHVGLVVMVNKYDGIDLPYDACRILVIDGLPDVRRKIDKIQEGVLAGSDELLSQHIQRIEQGMGRAIRANDDQCIVFLMGRSLISRLYAYDALKKLRTTIMYSLTHDTNWVRASKGALVHLRYEATGMARPLVLAQRSAFDAAQRRDYKQAVAALQEVANAQTDPRVKGWIKQQLAEYMHFTDPVKSQVILRSAVEANHMVLHPIEGISYTRLDTTKMNQARQCADYLVQTFADSNRLVLAVHSLLEDIIFKPETSEKFEEAMKQLAFLLGFKGQRPEAEFGSGPDVLWGIGSMEYLVIECKNGATAQAISKHYCDQLSGSMNWFAKRYSSDCHITPIMAHPVHIVEANAYPLTGMRVINERKLGELKDTVLAFVHALVSSDKYGDPEEIAGLLNNYNLTEARFVDRFTVAFRSK